MAPKPKPTPKPTTGSTGAAAKQRAIAAMRKADKRTPAPKPTGPAYIGNPAFAADKYPGMEDGANINPFSGPQISEPVNEWDRNPLADYPSNAELFRKIPAGDAQGKLDFYNQLEARRAAEAAVQGQKTVDEYNFRRSMPGSFPANFDWEQAQMATILDRSFSAGNNKIGTLPNGGMIGGGLAPDLAKNRLRAVNAARRQAEAAARKAAEAAMRVKPGI